MKTKPFNPGDKISLRKWDRTVPPYARLGDAVVTSVKPWRSESGWRVEFKTVNGGVTYELDQNWLDRR